MINSKLVLSLGFVFLFVKKTEGQYCSCSDMLGGLVSKVEANYAGYIHKVKETPNTNYVKFKEGLAKKATTTTFNDCYDILVDYVKWFKDGHLFIVESPSVTAQQSDSLAALVKNYSGPANYEVMLNSGKILDPIQGIWKDGNQTIAIVRVGADQFYGIIQQTNSATWKPGMVKMEIRQTKDKRYNITIRRNDFAPVRFRSAAIYKNILLPFGAYRFAKILPAHTELKYIHQPDPQLPFFQSLDSKTNLLTVPSALIGRNQLDSVLKKYDQLIKSTDNLIIDIRGNGGGNSIWSGLRAIANTVIYPEQRKQDEEDYLMLASPDNATYVNNSMASWFRQNKDSGGMAFYDKLINRIHSNTGHIIPFSFYDPEPDTARRTVYEYPKRIAIITDRGVGSAAEAFVMSMKANSSKLKVYGDNTRGMIDYMNTTTIWFGCPQQRQYLLGYPTFFSESIKTKPINPTGLKPDVYVPANIDDWIKWVADDLKKK